MKDKLAHLMEPAARRLLGEPNPNLSKPGKLRYGTKGSIAVDLDKGIWYDHENSDGENKVGGGPFELIRHKLPGVDPVEWLKSEGLIKDDTIVAAFDYPDETNKLSFQVVRTATKRFWQRRPDGNGGWINDIKGVRRVLYRLPELVAGSASGDTVFIPEGEKHVDALIKLGLRSTCNAGGVGKWRAEYGEFLRDQDVVVLPDCDPQATDKKTGKLLFHPDGRPRLPGQDHAEAVARHLHGVAASVKVLMLPGLPPKGDVIDWLAAGGTKEKFLELAAAAPEWKRANEGPVAELVNWRDIRNKHGDPAPSLANAVIAIRALGIGCKYNLFLHSVIANYRGDAVELRNFAGGEVTDNVLGAIRSLINNRFGVDMGLLHTEAAVREIARENTFDPILDYLAEVEGKWDHTKRIDTWLIKYCKTEDTPFSRAVGRMHLIASVRRARRPGAKYDYILVLESPEGWNKSTAVEVLAGKEYFSDQTILGLQDRVAQEQMSGVWLYEIADLTGMSKADVDKVKAFASRTTDRARPAFGRVVEKRARRCTVWGTTNDDQYLKSQTGNRRFLPVEVGRIDLDALKRDCDQIWGEAVAAETAGESVVLGETLWAAAAEQQEKRRVTDPWEDILANIPETVDTGDPDPGRLKRIVYRADGEERISTQDLLTYVLGVPPGQQHAGHGQRLATILKRHGWQRPKTTFRIGGKMVRGYWRLVELPLKGGETGNG